MVAVEVGHERFSERFARAARAVAALNTRISPRYIEGNGPSGNHQAHSLRWLAVVEDAARSPISAQSLIARLQPAPGFRQERIIERTGEHGAADLSLSSALYARACRPSEQLRALACKRQKE